MFTNGNYLKRILILNDGVTGHLRQAEAVAFQAKTLFERKGNFVEQESIKIDVKFKRRRIEKILFFLKHPLAFFCKGCARCMRNQLSGEDFSRLASEKADVVISPFGKRTAEANLWLSQRVGARAIVLMTPNIGLDRFDLAIVPRHDRVEPGQNVVITEGSPNLNNADFIRRQASLLEQEIGPLRPFKIGLFIGGNYKRYQMDEKIIDLLLNQVQGAAVPLDADILATTSRRTPEAIENLMESRLRFNQQCQLLIIANKNNRAAVVPAMLGLCDVLIISPESVSMISEAASSGMHVLVYDDPGFVGQKHRLFLENLQSKGYIHLLPIHQICSSIVEFHRTRMKTKTLDDSVVIHAALEKVLR